MKYLALLLVVVAVVGVAAWRIADGGIAAAGPAAAQPESSSEMSPEQDAILSDGVVTREEVIAALNAAADCVEVRGVRAARPGHPQLEGNLELMVQVPDGSDFQVASAAMRECSLRHSAAATSTYRAQTR